MLLLYEQVHKHLQCYLYLGLYPIFYKLLLILDFCLYSIKGKYLKDALKAASKVEASVFVEQGLKGLEIKEAMAKARLNAIETVKDHYQIGL